MGNRYRTSNMAEVWESFEHLYRHKLEELDHMTRQMMNEMTYSGCDREAIARFVRQSFADLWESVATEQDQRTPDRRRAL